MKIITILLAFVMATLLYGGPSKTTVTRLISPDDSKPLEYMEWKETLEECPYCGIGKIAQISGRGGKVNLIVNADLYFKLYNYLNPDSGQFVADIIADGYTVSVDTMSMSSDPFAPDSLRNYLANEGCIGAVLIGDLPIPWFQMMEVFYGWAPHYTTFPIDLFYMDIDGVWEDNYTRIGGSMIAGSDSIYDTHSGSLEPDIFIGRLVASPVGNDSALLSAYFNRNHEYRNGDLNLFGDTALLYVDDDWAGSINYWKSLLSAIYDSIYSVSDNETTIASDYKNRIKMNYEWISLFAHSWPGGHSFTYNNGNNYSYYYSYEIITDNPPAKFYNLFCCSNARYTESDYCAGMYIFNTSTGLEAIGSTKTGSMLEFQYYYNRLSTGECFGDAFKYWFGIMAEAWGDTSRSWFYGMTLIGDPTLVMKDTLSGIVSKKREQQESFQIVIKQKTNQGITFHINGSSITRSSINIYNLAGREIYGINFEGETVEWCYKNRNGSEIPNGTYLYKVISGNQVGSGKVNIIR
jgi:hypothetical protein